MKEIRFMSSRLDINDTLMLTARLIGSGPTLQRYIVLPIQASGNALECAEQLEQLAHWIRTQAAETPPPPLPTTENNAR